MDVIEQRGDLQFQGCHNDAGHFGDVEFLRDAQAVVSCEYYIGLRGGYVSGLSFDSQRIVNSSLLDANFQALSLGWGERGKEGGVFFMDSDLRDGNHDDLHAGLLVADCDER